MDCFTNHYLGYLLSYWTVKNGVVVTKHISRLSRVEYEHVVPASKFGSTFDEWKFGSPICVKSSGKLYKGRKCANRANYKLYISACIRRNSLLALLAHFLPLYSFPELFTHIGLPNFHSSNVLPNLLAGTLTVQYDNRYPR
jgi:hypothetical protein